MKKCRRNEQCSVKENHEVIAEHVTASVIAGEGRNKTRTGLQRNKSFICFFLSRFNVDIPGMNGAAI